MITKIIQSYKSALRDKVFYQEFLTSIFVLAVALVANFFAAVYATERASNSVTDLILSNIRVYDVDMVFIYGPLVMFVLVAFFIFAEPRRIPFVLKSIGLFVLIRSGFVTLTHLGAFPTQAVLDPPNFWTYISTGRDLFFSGHTGLPFLMALIFWERVYLRYIFIALSIIFGAVVLMGHLHYSIDVASAFFITYTIYHLATVFFPKAKRIFDETRVLPETL